LKGIVAYTAKFQGKSVLLTRAYSTHQDNLLANSWEQIAEFLTVDMGEAFHIVWDLKSFTDVIFSLLPAKTREELKTKPKTFYDNTKIFSVDRWLGITLTQPIKNNICERRENNFFGISHWLPPRTDLPADISEIVKHGEAVLAGLERMGIIPDKLTSPVGVFTGEFRYYDLPTIYSNEEIIDASNYCANMMRHEWRSAFKLGFFEQTYSYDMIAGYPSFIANFPNTDKCRIQFRDSYIKSDWAIVKGEIEVYADISPIVYDTGEGYINPKGKWPGYFTKEEINWLLKRGLGKFKMTDGYFIDWLSCDKPYSKPVQNLFSMRGKDDEMVNNLAKRAAQGISGKLDQDNADGSLGEFYNPILAAITRSRCRLAVAGFIYDNNLLDNVLAIQVDGCLTDKQVEVENSGRMGSWRFDGESPSLICGKGEIWKPDKKPLNISYDEIMEALRKHPNRSFYKVRDSYIDLMISASDVDRKYEGYPKTGADLLNNIYESKAATLSSP